MGCLSKKSNNLEGILPLILLFCLCGDNGFDDILGDFDEWLPLLILFFCLCGNNGFDDIFDDFDEWLPWIAVLVCCCFKH